MTVPATRFSKKTPQTPGTLPQRSGLVCRWFCWWVRGYLAKHFHGVRLSRGTRPSVPLEMPLIVVLNHPSWWDPLLGMVLSGLFPERRHYVPMDAKSLDRYPLFRTMGFYGVEQGTPRGALAFLNTTTAILSQPGTAVWITAQGQFTDPRVRPAGLRSGIGHLVRRSPQAVLVPLALEYPFWNERLPEALARFGEPIRIEPGQEVEADDWRDRIESGLTATQEALTVESIKRDPDGFETLLKGQVAIGGFYDRWRRLQAWLRGERFQAEHGSEGGSR